MILVIILAGVFYKYAKANHLSTALWTSLSVLGYFAAQFIGAFLAMLISESIAYNEGAIIVVSIASSLAFELALYLIMVNYAKKQKSQNAFSDILDDDILN